LLAPFASRRLRRTGRTSPSCAGKAIPTWFCCKNLSHEAADPDIPILKQAKAEYAKLQ
jgi:hypothetical protein